MLGEVTGPGEAWEKTRPPLPHGTTIPASSQCQPCPRQPLGVLHSGDLSPSGTPPCTRLLDCRIHVVTEIEVEWGPWSRARCLAHSRRYVSAQESSQRLFGSLFLPQDLSGKPSPEEPC